MIDAVGAGVHTTEVGLCSFTRSLLPPAIARAGGVGSLLARHAWLRVVLHRSRRLRPGHARRRPARETGSRPQTGRRPPFLRISPVSISATPAQRRSAAVWHKSLA